MGQVVGMLMAAAITLSFFVGVGALMKWGFFQRRTMDGDTVGNRLHGHGPDDEVTYSQVRTRVSSLWRRDRSDRSARDR